MSVKSKVCSNNQQAKSEPIAQEKISLKAKISTKPLKTTETSKTCKWPMFSISVTQQREPKLLVNMKRTTKWEISKEIQWSRTVLW